MIAISTLHGSLCKSEIKKMMIMIYIIVSTTIGLFNLYYLKCWQNLEESKTTQDNNKGTKTTWLSNLAWSEKDNRWYLWTNTVRDWTNHEYG